VSWSSDGILGVQLPSWTRGALQRYWAHDPPVGLRCLTPTSRRLQGHGLTCTTDKAMTRLAMSGLPWLLSTQRQVVLLQHHSFLWGERAVENQPEWPGLVPATANQGIERKAPPGAFTQPLRCNWPLVVPRSTCIPCASQTPDTGPRIWRSSCSPRTWKTWLQNSQVWTREAMK
jgi:hypothetical protein